MPQEEAVSSVDAASEEEEQQVLLSISGEEDPSGSSFRYADDFFYLRVSLCPTPYTVRKKLKWLRLLF